jgi:hypothetical protein
MVGLASIGTPEVEAALLEMDSASANERVRALVCFGSRQTVEKAIELAECNGGPKWLLDNARYGFMMQWHSSEYFRTDIQIGPLLEYAGDEMADREVLEYLESILDDIDTPVVRDIYARWWRLRGTSDDVKLTSPKDKFLSTIAERELMRRGDDRVLEVFIDEQVRDCIKHRVHEFVIRDFAKFERSKVLHSLRKRLSIEQDDDTQVVVIELSSRLGDSYDAEIIGGIGDSSASVRVANAAFESRLRLLDPLRLAEHW